MFYGLQVGRNAVSVDLAVELITENDLVLEVLANGDGFDITRVPELGLPQEVEPPFADDPRRRTFFVRAEEDRGAENALESRDQPSVLFPSFENIAQAASGRDSTVTFSPSLCNRFT